MHGTSNILLDDLFKHVVDKVEGLYTHWFLGELGNHWSDLTVLADGQSTASTYWDKVLRAEVRQVWL